MSTIASGLPDISSVSVLDSDYEDRRKLNAESLVGRLNYDVLGNIFMQNAFIDLFHPHLPSQTLRRSSQVCYAWRDCALGHPALWGASLDFGDPVRWIEECIARSASSSLYDIILPSLTTHLMGPGHLDWLRTSSQRPRQTFSEIILTLSSSNMNVRNLQFGMSVVHRARNAYVKARKRNWNYVNDALGRPAPDLRFFSLCLQGSQQAEIERYDLREDLFAGNAPNLRGLELRGCGCNFTLPILRNLTTFVVKRPSSGRLPPLTSWLGILSKMKDLEVLELGYCTAPVTADDDLTGWPTVALPNLRSFTLTSDLQACSFLLTHLTMPDACSVTVKCMKAWRGDLFSAMLAAVHDRIQRMPSARVKGAVALHTASTGLGFTKQYVDEEGQPELINSYRWYMMSRHTEDVVVIIPDILPTLAVAAQDVPELRLDFNNSQGITAPHTRNLLSVFESVERLHMVMPYTVWRVLGAMKTEDESEGADADIANDILPNLKTMLLEHVLFRDDSDKVPKADDLIQFIFGRPSIEKVTLINCEPTEYIAEELELFGISCTTIGAVTQPIEPPAVQGS